MGRLGDEERRVMHLVPAPANYGSTCANHFTNQNRRKSMICNTKKQHPSKKKLSHRVNSKQLPCTLLLRSMLRSRHMALHKTFRLELLDPSICPCFRLVSIVVLIENCTNEFVIANSFRFAVIETCRRWRHAKHLGTSLSEAIVELASCITIVVTIARRVAHTED